MRRNERGRVLSPIIVASEDRTLDAIVQNRLEIRLFGAMEVVGADGRSFLPPLRKTQAIFAFLALAGSQSISREQLVSLLWSRRDRDHAHASLRQCVYQLRDVLQPLGVNLLRTERSALALDSSSVWVDAIVLQRATRARPDIVELLRGPLLQDLHGLDPAFDRWLEAERQRMIARGRVLAEELLAAETEPVATIAAAERLLRVDPGHQGAWRALMLSYARQGNQAAAAQAFERCSIILAQSSGLMPSVETVALMDHIRQGGCDLPPPNVSQNSTIVPTGLLAGLAPELGQASAGVRNVTGAGASRGSLARLGILPLRPLNHISEEFAAGLAEEITTALSRFRCMTCIVPAGFNKAGAEKDLFDARDLDFLVEGSVQSNHDQTRVMMRLRDVNNAGQVVWSQRFQSDLTDMMSLQGEIASQTVAQINSELLIRESQRLESRPPADPTASQLLLRAIRAIFRLQRGRFLKAGELLAAAVERDPDFAAAHAWWAYWHVLLLGQGWASDPETATARTWDLTKRAIALDPYDPHALTLAGHVRAFTHRRLDEAIALHNKAISINPNLPLAWLFSGLSHTYLGEHAEGIRRIQRARQLSPLDPHGFFFDMALTLCHMLKGESSNALSAAHDAAAANPEFSASFKAFLSVLGHGDDSETRSRVLEQLLLLEPNFTVTDALARSPLYRSEDRARFADGLRLGGLPR
jgi:DNA-binding SARP family transcriptional activator/TolB-like protein